MSGTLSAARLALRLHLVLDALGYVARAAIPDGLAVTGWDDTDSAGPAGLTTVRQSLREQGAQCARLALGQSEEYHEPRWQVIHRHTSRDAPAG